MTAFYSIIRFTPDPVRAEHVNVGLVAWSGDVLRVSVQDQAFARARCLDPSFAADTFVGLAEYCSNEIASRWSVSVKASHPDMSRLLDRPFALSRPLEIDIDEHRVRLEIELELDSILAHLDELLIKPKKAARAEQSPGLRRPVKELVRNAIDAGSVRERFTIVGGDSQLTREIPFVALGDRQVPLDVFQVRSNQSDESLLATADEYCGRLTDLYRSNQFDRVYLYLPSDQRDNVRGMAGGLVRYIRRASNADVVTRAEDAAEVLLEAVR